MSGRPDSLARVAEIAAADPLDFPDALDAFLDGFYLEYPHAGPMQSRIDTAPVRVGDAFIDAWLGAAGEHLARRWGLHVPAWTARPHHFRLGLPRFVPDARALRDLLRSQSPAAFRSRNLFTVAEPMRRARFPHEARMPARAARSR